MNQFQKTPEEREAIKIAKKAYKQNKEVEYSIIIIAPEVLIKEKSILDGPVLEGENILPIDYEVYSNYLYLIVFNDYSTRVVRSNVRGDIRKLIIDLEKRGYKNINHIRNCKLFKRNLL